MKPYMVAVCIVTLCVGSAAAADEPPTYSASYKTCISKAGAADDQRAECVNAETANQDKALNEAYAHLQTRLNTYQKEALTTSERAWIKFRDSECDFRGSVLIGGPLGIEARAQKDARADCVLRETFRRSRSLNDVASKSWDGTR